MKPVLGLGARLSKLRAMSSREIARRVGYQCVLKVERLQHRRGSLAPHGRLASALAAPLRGDGWPRRLVESRQRHAGRFLAGVGDPAAMRRLFDTVYTEERDATLLHAAAARDHRFRFFGAEFKYGESIDWQADPVTRVRWPELYHAEVPVHRGNVGFGDVKHVWELSRQQFLIDLAKAYFLARDPRDLASLRGLVRSWIAGNPYATGVNWACALEPAFRVFSWLWAYYLTLDGLDDDFHGEWLTAFYDHGRFLSRHLEHYSSPYNHLVGEAAALYMLGGCFPEFRSAGRWKRLGRDVLERRLDEQFYADGGSVEQSTFYHHATVGFLLLAALTARAAGEDASPRIWSAIERGIEFSLALMQPDGTTPRIGGADDGKPIRMEHLRFWDFRPYQAIGAVLFERGDFKAVAGRFYEDALWLLGPRGLERFASLEASVPGAKEARLGSSGYYVVRSGWDAGADYVCFDCGEQAAGMRTDAIPNSMHGHADCLSVIAWLRGRPVLVDSGLYAYNCGGEWEAHFRETAAHNTARVDGRDQALHIGKMAWSHSYRASFEGMDSGGWSWMVGSHDGFARGPGGVTHRRALALAPGAYLVIYDEFTGAGGHDLEANCHFAPGRLDMTGPAAARFDAGVDVRWFGSADWTPDVCVGGNRPADGWIADSLGVLTAAPRLRLRARMAAPPTALLMVLSRADAPAPVVAQVNVADSGAGLLAVRTADGVDWIFARGIGDRTVIETDGCLGLCRVRGGTVAETAHVGGSFLRCDRAALARAAADRALEGEGS